MNIEQFVAHSLGEWRSMRSSHSLAFKHFEEIVSKIKIKPLDKSDPKVKEIIQNDCTDDSKVAAPFQISWEADSNWSESQESEMLKGSTILVPIVLKEGEGLIIRSMGYTEKMKARSKYSFLSDGTMVLTTDYNFSLTEERIWFTTRNFRCRSSIVRAKDSLALLQASYCSEVKLNKAIQDE